MGGVMATHDPQPCSHTFVWHAVIPPSHCPTCGRCLGCGGPQPVYPAYPAPPVIPANPWRQWPNSTPYYITYSGDTTVAPQPPRYGTYCR